MTGRPGKWPWKNHSVAVTPLIPTIRFASASYSTIRSTSRNGQRCGISACDLAGRVDGRRSRASVRVGRRLRSVAAPVSARRRSRSERDGLCRCARPRDGGPRTAQRARRGGQERRAPDPVEQVRRHPALEEGLVERAAPGGSTTLVTTPSTTQLVEGHAAAGDGGRPVRAPDDELAEERVVERRDLVAAVQVRVHPDARAARARGSARRRRRRAGSRGPGPRR